MTIAQLNPVNTVTNRPKKKKIGRINEGFFIRKCMALLPAGKKSGRNSKVTVLPRWL